MPNRMHRILYIEDDEGLARLLQKRMSRAGYHVDIALTGEEGLEKQATQPYDLILVDYYLPGINGLEVIRKLAPGDTDAPMILLTAGGDERVAIDALQSGAADYAVKDTNQVYLELLPAIMQAAFVRVRLTREPI